MKKTATTKRGTSFYPSIESDRFQVRLYRLNSATRGIVYLYKVVDSTIRNGNGPSLACGFTTERDAQAHADTLNAKRS